MEKILCLCDHGEVRSVAMAKVLRERGHFAVAGSYENVLKTAQDFYETKTEQIELIKMLFGRYGLWDEIIFMQEGGEHFIGRDEYGDIDHPELRQKCIELAERLKL
jgi:hypothetical protein